MRKSWLFLIVLLLATPALATETVDSKEGDLPVTEEPVVRKAQDLKKKFTKEPAGIFQIIGEDIQPGTRRDLRWSSPQSPGGFAVPTPVIVVHGLRTGPVLGLTASIHGDELNGIEIARRIMLDIDPKKLRGTVVAVPIVNIEGFWRRDRYIGDRRDLNRYFPGSPDGPYPGRVAYALFTEIIQRCDAVVDLHTGSFYRENLPQLRVDLTVKEVAELAKGFGALTVLHSPGPSGSLRGAATAAGIPTVVMEIGGPLSLELDKVELGVKSLRALLHTIGMSERAWSWSQPQPVYYSSDFIRAESGGILINIAKLGDRIKAGNVLAEIIDPVSNTVYPVKSPIDGTVLGRAQNQFVSPGFAIFRIGYEKSPEELEKKAETEKVKAAEEAVEEAVEELVETEDTLDRKE